MIYKLLYHIAWILLTVKEIALQRDVEYNWNIIHLHLDVLKFFYNKKLGLNMKYTP